MLNWLYRKMFPNHVHLMEKVNEWTWNKDRKADKFKTVKLKCCKCGLIEYHDIKI